jgi:serine/threonine-protein kinase
MSPEQLLEGPVDHRSDLYALGVVAFELLSGRRPYQAATLGELMRSVAIGAPADLARLRPDLPAPLVADVKALLSRHPADRPSSAREIARDWLRQGGLGGGLGPKSRA